MPGIVPLSSTESRPRVSGAPNGKSTNNKGFFSKMPSARLGGEREKDDNSNDSTGGGRRSVMSPPVPEVTDQRPATSTNGVIFSATDTDRQRSKSASMPAPGPSVNPWLDNGRKSSPDKTSSSEESAIDAFNRNLLSGALHNLSPSRLGSANPNSPSQGQRRITSQGLVASQASTTPRLPAIPSNTNTNGNGNGNTNRPGGSPKIPRPVAPPSQTKTGASADRRYTTGTALGKTNPPLQSVGDGERLSRAASAPMKNLPAKEVVAVSPAKSSPPTTVAAPRTAIAAKTAAPVTTRTALKAPVAAPAAAAAASPKTVIAAKAPVAAPAPKSTPSTASTAKTTPTPTPTPSTIMASPASTPDVKKDRPSVAVPAKTAVKSTAPAPTPPAKTAVKAKSAPVTSAATKATVGTPAATPTPSTTSSTTTTSPSPIPAKSSVGTPAAATTATPAAPSSTPAKPTVTAPSTTTIAPKTSVAAAAKAPVTAPATKKSPPQTGAVESKAKTTLTPSPPSVKSVVGSAKTPVGAPAAAKTAAPAAPAVAMAKKQPVAPIATAAKEDRPPSPSPVPIGEKRTSSFIRSSSLDELDDEKETSSGDLGVSPTATVPSGNSYEETMGGPDAVLPSFGAPVAKGTRTSSISPSSEGLLASALRRTSDAAAGEPAKAANTEGEEEALAQYIKETELDLSMSTFTTLGTLGNSLALRVLNLKGSTMGSEGLRGLADVKTLSSICVSHMKQLTSLGPMITPTKGGHCMIQEIDAQCSPLTDSGLNGLEQLPNLKKLDLSMTPVCDVRCLAKSRSLTELVLTATKVDSIGIQGLENIPTLKVLNLGRTKVTSLSGLVKSTSIETLILYSCKITDADVRGIENMPRLQTLDVSTTKITDLSIFRVSTSLKSIKAQWLALKNCTTFIQERRGRLADVALDSSMAWGDMEAGYAGLGEIPTLETVDLSFNTIRSMHSLCKSKSIKHLTLYRTRLENDGIRSLRKLAPTLETLIITNIQTGDGFDEEDEGETQSSLLSDVSDVAALQKLVRLDLSFTDVFDLRMLQVLKHLEELNLVETLVTDDGLRGIEKIPSLRVLDLSQTSVVSLQFLSAGAPALERIIVRSSRNTRGFRLGRLERLPSLISLDISDTVVEDIKDMWKPAWQLKELIWRWKERREATGPVPALECWVTSERLTGIAKLPKLTTLDISNSSVLKLTFLEGAKALQTVILNGCRLLRDETLQSIAKLSALEELDLSNSPHICDVSPLAACRQLRVLRLTYTGVTQETLQSVSELPNLKTLEILNTKAEEALVKDTKKKSERSHSKRKRSKGGDSGDLGGSKLLEASGLMGSSAAPAGFRKPRRRRVSFVSEAEFTEV